MTRVRAQPIPGTSLREDEVRSKFNGAYQLYSVAFNKYSRPIKSPVHNMRPARDPVALEEGKSRHPVSLGDLSGTNCTACHRHTRAFQHPVNLGDLSRFKCADCHSGKNWTLEGD